MLVSQRFAVKNPEVVVMAPNLDYLRSLTSDLVKDGYPYSAEQVSRLLSSHKELLEALELYVESDPDNDMISQLAKIAIRNAKGI